MPLRKPLVVDLRRLVPVIGVCAVLAGCAGQVRMGPVEDIIRPQPDHCGAGALTDLAGQPFTLLADHPLPGPLRVLWPGQEITDDVDTRRLNAQVTNDQQILRLFCG